VIKSPCAWFKSKSKPHSESGICMYQSIYPLYRLGRGDGGYPFDASGNPTIASIGDKIRPSTSDR